MEAVSGRNDDAMRSDCFFSLTENGKRKNSITIESKVTALYGNKIQEQVEKLVNHFGLIGLDIYLKDAGALPFVIAARFETAVKRLFPDIKTEYLPAWQKTGAIQQSEKFQRRRSRLYLPGNEPKYFTNAGLHKPDAIILDLEDSVAPSEKDAARLLVRNALRAVNFYQAERMVRINQLPLGIEDLKAVLPNKVSVILLPKTENPEQVKLVELEIEKHELHRKDVFPTYIMPIIESAAGVVNAYDIARASQKICSLAIGLEDYTADIGVQKTESGTESLFARSKVVQAAKAAGIQAIDSVFSDVQNMDALLKSVSEAKALGFEGKGVIHPRQIPVVHEGFRPNPVELEKAKAIYNAYQDATARGVGVVAIGSKMIDAPVVKRAIKLIEVMNSEK
jgi:citrate lyase subunit beta/citryl-CoA lyase